MKEWRDSKTSRGFSTITNSTHIVDKYFDGHYCGSPKVGNKLVIMVVVDRLSKYAHFFFVQHPFTPVIVVQFFLDHIFKLRGMSTSIMFDRDPNFTSKLWK